MSEYVVNEPRRHRERLNLNDPDGHRAVWNLSRRRETDAGWNARPRTPCPLAQVVARPAEVEADSTVEPGTPAEASARPSVENAA